MQIIVLDRVVKMSTSHDEGLASVRDLFADSESDVSIEEIVDDETSGVDSPGLAKTNSVSSGSVVCSTPVRKEVRVVAPRSVKCQAKFSGGSLDRRTGGFRGSKRGSVPDSPAGDLELPSSRTWSNGPRNGRVRERFGTAGSWDTCPVDPVDIDEAIALKGRRNNRAMAEQVIGEWLFVVNIVNLICFPGDLFVVCKLLILFVFREICESGRQRGGEKAR